MKNCSSAVKAALKVRRVFGGIARTFIAIAAFAFAGAAWGHTQKEGAKTWTYDLVAEDGNIVAIVQAAEPIASEQLTIPSTLGGYPVRIIADNAFNSQIWSGVTIPSSVTNIGMRAFYGCSYMSGALTIPANVVKIGGSAFAGCNGLTSVTIKDGVKTIAGEAFRACSSLTTVSIPDSVTSIESDAFMSCENLRKADVLGSTFDGSLTKDKAFRGTSSDFSLVFREKVGDVTFYYTVNGSGDAVVENGGDKAIKPSEAENVTIPGTLGGHKVTSVGKEAFMYCNRLANVTFPDGLIAIGEKSFAYCVKLSSLTLPDSVLMIGKDAFENCSALVEVDLNNAGVVLGDYAFAYCDNLKTVTFPSAIIAAGLGKCVFANNPSLQSVTAPADALAAIMDNEVFKNCPATAKYTFYGKATVGGVTFSYIWNPGDGIQIGDGTNTAVPSDTTGAISIPSSLEVGGYGTYYVRTIAKKAFYLCNGITGVTIPNTVRTIGEMAFARCPIRSVTIPDSVTTIDYGAFYGTDIASITVPSSVTYLGGSVFKDCKELTSVTIGSGVKNIPKEAFRSCEKLSSFNYIKNANAVTSIGASAFEGCKALTQFSTTRSFQSLGNAAFKNCTSLKTITLPEDGFYPELYSDASLRNGIFENCPFNLEIIFLPADSSSKERASLISEVVWFYTVVNGNACLGFTYETPVPCIYPAPTGAKIGMGAMVSIPDRLGGMLVTEIGNCAFKNCTAIGSVIIPASVDTIHPNAFEGCTGLLGVALPANLKSIGERAFAGCTGMTSVNIPDKVASVAANAFYGCSKISQITLPRSFWHNYDNYFTGCPDNLSTFYRWDDGAMKEWANNAGWVFKVDGTEATVVGGSSMVGERVMPSKLGGYSVTAIADNALSGKTMLTRLTIPEGVTTIGENAFASCSKLESVDIPDSMKSIGKGAFSECAALEYCYLPDNGNVTKIADRTFYKCTNLVDVAYNYAVTEVGDYAFYGCSAFSGFSYGPGAKLEKIGTYAFAGCTDLYDIYVPDTTTSIADYAFAGCSKLNAASLPGALAGTFDEAHVFYGCSYGFKATYRYADGEYADVVDGIAWRYKYTDSNSKVTILGVNIPIGKSGKLLAPSTLGGKTVTAIAENAFKDNLRIQGFTIISSSSIAAVGAGAFSGCYNMKTLSLGPVETIGESAFAGCSALTAVVLDNVTRIDEGAFDNCTGLTTVTVPDGIVDFGYSAFEGCTGLVTASLPSRFYAGFAIENWFEGCPESLVVTFRFASGAVKVQKIGKFKWTMKGTTLFSVDNTYNAISPKPMGSVEIPAQACGSTVKTIGAYAFAGCTGMTKVTIPVGVTKIEEHAFDGCTWLSEVVFPSTLQSIGDYAFKDCTKLTAVDLPDYLQGKINTSVVFNGYSPTITYYTKGGIKTETFESRKWYYRINDGEAEIYNNDKVAVENPPTSGMLNIPTTLGGKPVTRIGKNAFYDDYNYVGCEFSSVFIPDTVTSIGESAFQSCANLEHIYGGDGLKDFEKNAFSSCNALAELPLKEGARSLGLYAFARTAVTSVTLPSTLTSIYGCPFDSCPNLTEVSIPASLDDVISDENCRVFYYSTAIENVTLSSDKQVERFAKILPYSKVKHVTLAEGVTSIAAESFTTYIGTEATANYVRLESITLPTSLKSIGARAFIKSDYLKSVEIPAGVTSIGAEAFYQCSALESVNIPAGLTDVGNYAFCNCTKLTSVTFEPGLTAIGATGVFSTCTGLASVTIPEGVTSIAESAFDHCSALATVTIPQSVETIGEKAFRSAGLATVHVAARDTARVKGLLVASGLDQSVVDGITFVAALPDFWFIEFDGNGGTASAAIYNVAPGEALGELPTAVLDESYDFDGWFTEAEGGSEITPATKATGDVTYYAHWSFKQYTVTVDSGTGIPVPVEVDYGTTVGDVLAKLPEPTLDGYVFKGWVDDDGNPLDLSAPVTADTAFHAEWAKIIDIEIWNVKDGVVDGSWSSKMTDVVSGDSLFLDSVALDGYVFLGWSYEPNGEIMPPDTVIVPADDLNKLYAQFALDVWTVTFDANGGFCETPSVSVAKEAGAKLGSLPEATRAGFEFGGWWTLAGGGEEVKAGITAITGDVTFYAHWRNVAITEVVIPDGTVEIPDGAYSGYAGLVTVTIPSSVTKIGDSAFDGCTSLATVNVGSGDTARIKALLVASGLDSAFVNGLKFIEDTSLTYTVTFDANGGSIVGDASIKVKAGEKVGDRLPAATRPGYDFIGWKITDALWVDRDTVVTEDISCAAFWNPNLYTITFDANGGTISGNATFNLEILSGTAYPPLRPDTRPDWLFTGWFTEPDGGVEVKAGDAFEHAGNQTLYAHWREGTVCIVTLELNGGSYPETALEYDPGEEVGVLPIPLGPNGRNRFLGWFWDPEFTVEVLPTDLVTDNCTCYASWGQTASAMTAVQDGIVWSYYISGGNNKITLYNNGRPVIPSDYTGALIIPSKIAGKTVEGIGERAFYGCSGLTSVIIPDGVKEISDKAFAWCENLEVVQFGKGIGNKSTIFFEAFKGCTQLRVLDFKGTTPPYAVDNAFDLAGSGTEWGVPQAYVPKTAKGWSPVWNPFDINVNNYPYTAKVYVTYSDPVAGPACGKISLSGTTEIGKSLKLSATANSGYAFAGWWDADTGECLSRAMKYTYIVTGEDKTYQAEYVTSTEDYASLGIYQDDVETYEDGSIVIDLGEATESYSEPKLTVKGLPAGLKYDAKTLKVSGTATKPGKYTVTVTATNATRKNAKDGVTASFLLIVPNFVDDAIPVEDSYGPFIPGVPVEPVTISEAVGCKATGLPSGMKWTEKLVNDKTFGTIPPYSFYGTPTKPGNYTVYFTKTTVDKVKHTATATFMVDRLRKLTIVTSGASGNDSAKGAGDYAANAKVSLKATAGSGKVFSAWIDNCTGMVVSRAASYSYVMPAEDTTLTAEFTTTAEDVKHLGLSVGGVASFDQNTGDVVHDATVYQGVYTEWPLVPDTVSFATIKVAGLPAGLKFTAKNIVDSKTKAVTVYANTIYGTPTAATGKQSEVKITMTTAGKTTATYYIVTTVKPMQDWAVGTFEGSAAEGSGLSSLTVANTGKISGKITSDSGTWTIAGDGFEDYDEASGQYMATVSGKIGQTAFSETLYIFKVVEGTGVVGGAAILGEPPDTIADATQYNWKAEPWKSISAYFGGTLTFGKDLDDACPGTVTLAFKSNSGTVSIQGQFGAYKATASANITPITLPNEKHEFMAYLQVYFPRNASKGFGGYSIRVPLTWNGSAFVLP